MQAMNLNPTINSVQRHLSHNPATAKELSETITNSEGKPIPLGNILAILRTSKWAHFNGEKWELVR